MYIKQYNPNNLIYSKLDKIVTRVKILIFSDLDQLLLCNIDGVYSFVGGHVENNETLCDALYRELEEETGIVLDKKSIEPFYKIERWNENHFNTGKKCLSEIYYFYIKINGNFNIKTQKLDYFERQKNFLLQFVDKNNLKSLLSFETELYNEMLEVWDYFVINEESLTKKCDSYVKKLYRY